MEERSGSFLPELPYTNRGVIRQKEELSALIDWCQITIKEVPLEAVIEDVLKIPMELMTVTAVSYTHLDVYKRQDLYSRRRRISRR